MISKAHAVAPNLDISAILTQIRRMRGRASAGYLAMRGVGWVIDGFMGSRREEPDANRGGT
jgi:hypothetical protein